MTALASLQALKHENQDVAACLTVLGDISYARKEFYQAASCQTYALNIDLSLGNGAAAMEMEKSLVDTCTQMGQPDKAQDASAKAAALAKTVPTPLSVTSPDTSPGR